MVDTCCKRQTFILVQFHLAQAVIITIDRSPAVLRSQLMLYVAAARGNFEQGLREMDARAECILCPPLDQLTAHQRKVTQAVCYTCLHRVGGAENCSRLNGYH